MSLATNGGGVGDAPLRVLVMTPLTAIIEELQRRLSALPPAVRVEVAAIDGDEGRLVEQIRAADVIFGEPLAIADKMHVRHTAEHSAVRSADHPLIRPQR